MKSSVGFTQLNPPYKRMTFRRETRTPTGHYSGCQREPRTVCTISDNPCWLRGCGTNNHSPRLNVNACFPSVRRHLSHAARRYLQKLLLFPVKLPPTRAKLRPFSQTFLLFLFFWFLPPFFLPAPFFFLVSLLFSFFLPFLFSLFFLCEFRGGVCFVSSLFPFRHFFSFLFCFPKRLPLLPPFPFPRACVCVCVFFSFFLFFCVRTQSARRTMCTEPPAVFFSLSLDFPPLPGGCVPFLPLVRFAFVCLFFFLFCVSRYYNA